MDTSQPQSTRFLHLKLVFYHFITTREERCCELGSFHPYHELTPLLHHPTMNVIELFNFFTIRKYLYAQRTLKLIFSICDKQKPKQADCFIREDQTLMRMHIARKIDDEFCSSNSSDLSIGDAEIK